MKFCPEWIAKLRD